MPHPPADTRTPHLVDRACFRSRLGLLAVVYVFFLLNSFLQSPIPGPGEPHYLAKAKNFWNPRWCEGDLFLESADVHLLFYATFGWLTQAFTFEQSACIGRILALFMLAAGWTALIVRLLPRTSAAILATATYLLFQAIGNFSGEWVVEGFEGKVISYAFVFLSLAFALDARWLKAAFFAGLAIGFHPVIGVWHAVAGAMAVACNRWGPASLSTWLAAGGLFLATAMFGLIPALAMDFGTPREVAAEAARIQVELRLAHHLDPTTFNHWAYIGYGVLLAIWCLGRIRAVRTGNASCFDRYVLGTVLIAVAGLAVGYGPRWVSVMRFYPFRLFDAILPVATATVMAGLALGSRGRQQPENANQKHPHSGHQFQDQQPSETQQPAESAPLSAGRTSLSNAPPVHHDMPFTRRDCCLIGLGVVVFMVALALPAPHRNPSKMDPGRLADWKDVCLRIAEATPENALVFTLRSEWAFKWYAQRAQFFSYKDCPQDALNLIEWNRRRLFASDLAPALGKLRRDQQGAWELLGKLYEEHGITHLVSDRKHAPLIRPTYSNSTFVLFDLQSIAEE